MKALEERIVKEGKVLPGNVLKVGSFLNQQIDVALLFDMGAEVARLYANCGVSKVLTVEASGIAFAVAVAHAMGVDAVFAKKNKSSNVSGDVLSAKVHSYTHGTDFDIIVPKDYIKPEDKVLIVDDFLANGCALEGLASIVSAAGATTVGAAIEIEKGFQHGGDALREKGMRVESLAIIESMENGVLRFRN